MFKRFIKWCRTMVSHGLHWIEQQIMSQTKPSSATVVAGAVGDAVRSREGLCQDSGHEGENG
jgi:hypothetical protein